MIDTGSTVVLLTKDAIYSTCRIVKMSKNDVAVKFFKGRTWDKKTQRYVDEHAVDIVPRKKIISISERTK